MKNSAIEHLFEYPLSKSDVAKLPKDQHAVIAVLCFIASESNALAKTYIAASHEDTGETVIDTSLSILRFTILRAWSAKLFEVSEFLGFRASTTKRRINLFWQYPKKCKLSLKHLSLFVDTN